MSIRSTASKEALLNNNQPIGSIINRPIDNIHPLSTKPSSVVFLQNDVGFSNLANWHLQQARRGIYSNRQQPKSPTGDGVSNSAGSATTSIFEPQFNLLVVGAPGRGKATLLNTLFDSPVLPFNRPRYPTKISNDGSNGQNFLIKDNLVEFIEYQSKVEEAGVQLELNIVEVLGYGELGQRSKRREIVEYVKARLDEQFTREQSREVRHQIHSRLFHAALIFISPISNNRQNIGFDELGLIKDLQPLVNVIPLITKADSFLPVEFDRLKVKLRELFKRHAIADFPGGPELVEPADENWLLRDAQEIKARFPLFTACSHTQVVEIKSPNPSTIPPYPCRIRRYPWGDVNLEHEEWNDLFYLSRLLIRSFQQLLVVHTQYVLYESFRTQRINMKKRHGEAEKDEVETIPAAISVLPTPTDSEHSLLQKSSTLSPEALAQPVEETSSKKKKNQKLCKQHPHGHAHSSGSLLMGASVEDLSSNQSVEPGYQP